MSASHSRYLTKLLEIDIMQTYKYVWIKYIMGKQFECMPNTTYCTNLSYTKSFFTYAHITEMYGEYPIPYYPLLSTIYTHIKMLYYNKI